MKFVCSVLVLCSLILGLAACTPQQSDSQTNVEPLQTETNLATSQPSIQPTESISEVIFTATDQLWAGRSIYFIMTDRFSNGDPSNDNADGFASDRSDPRRWHGGDFRGIINQLDYIQGMGFDALWITPVTKQRSANAYHGYWQYDVYAIDNHFGSLADLQELVAAAHDRDMLVMLDVVANHTGDFIPGTIAAPPFDDPAWYHNQGNIENYGNQQAVEQGDLLGLDDLNQENPAARAELLKWIDWLRSETGADGFRVDTAKHMPKDFLAEFDQAAQVHTMGEVFSGDVEYVAQYGYQLDAVVDFPLYYGFKDALATGKPLQTIQRLLERDSEYRNPFVNGTFLDNHDVERFMCLASGGPDRDKQTQLHQALAVQFALRGIPIVYYATEQQFVGCTDPHNREDMFESFNAEAPTYQWLSTLNALRKQHPALSMGVHRDLFIDADHWAFERSYAGETLVVCVNNTWQPASFAAPDVMAFADGTVLHDQLGSAQVTLADQAIRCDLAPKQVAFFTQ